MLRVLVVDQSYMGDVLMSSPAYREIVKHFPGTELLTRPESVEVAEHCSRFSKIHSSWKTVGKIDIAIHLHTSFKTNLILLLKGIPLRIGYSYKWAGLPLNLKVKLPHRTIRVGYRVDEVCDLLVRAFGWSPERRMIFT